MSAQQRVLVAGGAGFLGSYLCERLLDQGHDVVCLDNFFTGQKSNVAHLLARDNFELIRHDVIEPIRLEVDRIYNLACPAAPGHYQYDPIQTLKTSVIGSLNLLGLAKRCRARILQASTSEVYGDPEIHPQVESYRGCVNPIGPRACYDEGKRAAETLFMDYRRMHGVSVRIARIFNTYGPRMHPFDGRVVSNFIRQALAADRLTIYGDGRQTRSFCYRDDLVEGLIRLMNCDEECGPVNLGNPGEFTIRELAEMVLELTGSQIAIEYRPLPVDDPTRRRPDITLAQRLLGWSPKIDLVDGLAATIESFRDLRFEDFRAPTPYYGCGVNSIGKIGRLIPQPEFAGKPARAELPKYERQAAADRGADDVGVPIFDIHGPVRKALAKPPRKPRRRPESSSKVPGVLAVASDPATSKNRTILKVSCTSLSEKSCRTAITGLPPVIRFFDPGGWNVRRRIHADPEQEQHECQDRAEYVASFRPHG